ncbi:MAG: IS110 family transposase [Chloroflexi bacterium]|nr:IS110 family transposase [Chloroflexota bacterium]
MATPRPPRGWYWIADEIEAAGCIPLFTHAAKAKLMMGHVNKTDKLDAAGLATLLHNGTLPTVWLPPGLVRDQRELPRTRMALTAIRTALKNRIHSTLAKYALSPTGISDLFSKKGRAWLENAAGRLPPETARCLKQELELLDALNDQIHTLEARIRCQVQTTPNMQLLKTLPGVGDILAIVIDYEQGSMDRFPGPEQFASYSGTTPKVSASGGKTHFGRLRQEANQYLKWAFIEAANVVAAHAAHRGWPAKHVARLYQRIRHKKGHAIAVGAVARHLSEAAFWVLRKQEPYKEPKAALPKQGQARN